MKNDFLIFNMGGVSIKNTRFLMLLMILTLVLVSLSSVSASDIENNETIEISEIDSIDISQNKNTVTDEPLIGESLDDNDVLAASAFTIREKETQSEDSVNIGVGDSLVIQVRNTGGYVWPKITYTNLNTGSSYTYDDLRVGGGSWMDYPSYTFSEEGTYSVVVTYSSWDPSNTLTVNVGSSSPFNLNIYEENHPDDNRIKYTDNSVTLSLHSIFSADSYDVSQLQSIVGSNKPVIYVDGVAKGNGNIGYDGVTSTADSITLTKGQHTIYYVLPASGDIENDIKSNELTVFVNLSDYYLRIYEEDAPDNTTFYYDKIYDFNIYNKLYNTLGLSVAEVKRSLYQNGDGYANPVTYYVNGKEISDSRTGYGYRPALWVDGTDKASSYSSYPNYIQWRPDSEGVYEIYAVYSATSALGTLKSDTITIYVGVLPDSAKDTTLTLTNETPINAKYGDTITITPNVVIKEDGTAINEGDVTFTYENGNVIDTVNLGQSLTLPTTLTEGTYNIKAVYNGVEGNYNPSEETTITVVISKYDVTISSFEVTSPTYPANAVASIVTDTPGTYTVRVNGKEYTITINEGETKGSVDIDVLDVKDGNYQANVTFASTEKYNEAFKETAFAVNKGNASVSASINTTSDIVYGDKIAVKGTSDVSGTIKIYENDNEIASGNANEWIELPSLSAATHILKLELINNNYDVASDSIEITVNTAEIELSIEVQNKVYPNEVTGTIRTNVPGTYTVKLDGETKTTVVIDETGFNTFVFGVLDVKNNYNASVSIEAIGNYSAAYDSKLFNVTVDGTTLTISPSTNDVDYGTSISFTHEISPSTATGTVQFYYASNNINIGNPVNVGEILSNIVLPAGTHQIAAKYVSSDDNYNDVNSNIITVTVNALSNPVVFDVAQNTIYNDEVVFDITNAIEGTYTIKFNDSSISDLTLTVNSGENSASGSILLPVGSYAVNLTWNGDNYNNVNLDKTFTVSKGTNTVTISSSGASFPNEVIINVIADLDGDYLITLNDTANTEVIVSVSSGSGSKSVKLDAGSYKTTTVSNPDANNYELDVNDATFNVSKGTNGAELVIAPQTTLPDTVNIAIKNAVAGDYIVVLNDTGKTEVKITVDSSGSASKSVALGSGSYKATLIWADVNYFDVNKESEFNVLEESVQVSSIFKITDYYSTNSTIYYDNTGRTVPMYQLNVNSAFYSEEIVLYINNQPVINMSSSISHSDYGYSHFYVDGSAASYSLGPGVYTVYAVYNGVAWIGDSYENERSNTITYVVSGEPIVTHGTNLTIYEDGTEKTGIIETTPGNLTVIVKLSSDELDGISEYLSYDSEGNVIDTITATLTYPDGSKVSGSAPLNKNGISYVTIPATVEGWYNVSVRYNGNVKGLQSSESNTISFHVTEKGDENITKYSTELSLSDYDDGKSGVIQSEIRDLNILITLTSSELGSSVGEYANASLVYLYQNGHLLGSLPLNYEGLALATIQPITNPGWYNFTVEFRGNDKGLLPSNASISYHLTNETVDDNVTVSKNASELSISIDSTTVNLGDDITISYELTTGATGSITFREGSAILGTVNVGDKFTINNLTQGVHFIEAKYNGDDNFNESVSNIVTVDVRALKNNLRISANNATYPDKVTVTVNADVDGIYNVSVNSEISTVTVTGGKGLVDLSLTPGEYTATVNFPGDGNYAANTASATFKVSPQNPDFNAFSNPESIKLGEYVNITSSAAVNGNVTYTLPNGSKIRSSVGDIVKIIPASTGDFIVTAEFEGLYSESQSLKITIKVNDTREVPQMNVSIPDEINVGEEISIIVKLPDDATGNITYTIDGNAVTLPVNQKLIIPTYNAGTKEIKVTYDGNDKYQSVSAVKTVRINKKESNVTVTISPDEIKVGDKVTIKANVSGSGNVTYTLNGILTTLPVGESLIINATVPGVNNLTVRYNGNNVYAPKSVDKTFNVKEIPSSDIIVSAPSVEKYYGGSERFRVKVTDTEGNPISGQLVEINIGGRTYNKTTNANGTVTAPLGLNSGSYNVTVKVNDTIVKSNALIKSTLEGRDVVMIYRNGSQYLVTFKDTQGNLLAENTTVEFNINGVLYERNVRSNGIARLNLNLEQGNYVITALNTKTGERCANNITILSNIIENRDITKLYRNGTQYTVKVLGKDGNPIGKGVNVTFNINGMMYTRTTNNQSIAKMNINLQPGDYVITAEYNGCKVSNNIKVLPVLSAKDLTKKFGNSEQFIATLVNGQGNPLAGEKVSFNINGVMYDRTTNANGQAKLNIKLQAGEYIITSTYKGASIANKVTVTA